MKSKIATFVALFVGTVLSVGCARPSSPTSPSGSVPKANSMSLVWTSPPAHQVKGASVSLMLSYEANRDYDVVASLRLDANGSPTESRSTQFARIRRGVGEIRLDGASVLLTSSTTRTDYIEVLFTEPGTGVVRDRIMIPRAIDWRWPVTTQ